MDNAPLDCGGRRFVALDVLVLACVLLGTLGAVFGGPKLGDHEALVAQCSRDMRTSGNWLVPQLPGGTVCA